MASLLTGFNRPRAFPRTLGGRTSGASDMGPTTPVGGFPLRDSLRSEPMMFPRSEGSMRSEGSVDSASCASLQVSALGYSEDFPVSGEVSGKLFRKVKLVGRGGVGKVYIVQLRDSDPPRLYAMKEVDKQDMIQRNKVKRVMTEREIFATSNHPFIITMYASFQTKTKLYFVMEYAAGGEFFKYLQRRANKRLSEDGSRFYAAEVLLALEYLHQMGFIYRDLKPENIMMRLNGHLALTDFDLSKLATPSKPRVVSTKSGSKIIPRFSADESNLKRLEIVTPSPVLKCDSNSFVGTEEYLSPEIVKGEAQSAAVDWWTLGILVYEMLCGATPFKGSEQKDTFENILKGDLSFPNNVLMSKEAKSLIKGLLTRDPTKRLGSKNGSAEIKSHPFFKSINFALIRNEDAPIRPDVPDPYDMSQYKPLKKEDFDSDNEDDAGDEFADFDTKVALAKTKY